VVALPGLWARTWWQVAGWQVAGTLPEPD